MAPAETPYPLPSLEQRLAELAARTQLLEARVATLEQHAAAEVVWTAEPPELPAVLEEGLAAMPSATTLVALVGRACLILGGGFLIRTGTDSGWLPPLAGVALALAYSVAWALLADRSARKGEDAWAGFQLIAAMATAFPMLWETTFRFRFLPAPAAAAILLAATVLYLTVAIRRDLRKAAWIVLLGALATAFTLMAATSAISSFVAFFILLGAATLLVSDSPDWRGLRWPAALGADLAVAVMAMLALAPGSEELLRDLRPVRVLGLSLALVGVYLGAILYRTLKRPRAVAGFEVFQAFAVMAVGYGGAIRVAEQAGAGVAVLGLAALALGLACYGCAFAFVQRETEGSLDFQFLASLGLVLLLAGGLLLLDGQAMALLCLGLGAAVSLLGVRFQRPAMAIHGTLYFTAAALRSGLLASTGPAFLASRAPAPSSYTVAGLLTILALGAGHLLALRGRDSGPVLRRLRLASLTSATLGALALGGLLVALCHPFTQADPGALAAVRTAVLVALALGAAAMGRWRPGSELPWLAYPLMGLSALKMLLEDFPHGRPVTLFLALTLLGCGLLAVARCARPAKA